MNLYLISQNQNKDYETYHSAVVAAPDQQAARQTHPAFDPDEDKELGVIARSMWCKTPADVMVKLLGTALEGTEAGVVCVSSNAG
jgi:hypothetical protein